MKEITFKNTKIRLYLGDITDLEVEAIVNAANNHLFMGAGVAGAIKRIGGKIIEQEAVKKGPIPIGEAIITTAGNLKAKYVIHAAGMGTDFKTDAEKIRNTTKNTLLRCEEARIKSVAFPSIGTGVGGFPLNKTAEIMTNVVKEHLSKETHLELIIFALFSQNAYLEFEKALSNF